MGGVGLLDINAGARCTYNGGGGGSCDRYGRASAKIYIGAHRVHWNPSCSNRKRISKAATICVDGLPVPSTVDLPCGGDTSRFCFQTATCYESCRRMGLSKSCKDSPCCPSTEIEYTGYHAWYYCQDDFCQQTCNNMFISSASYCGSGGSPVTNANSTRIMDQIPDNRTFARSV